MPHFPAHRISRALLAAVLAFAFTLCANAADTTLSEAQALIQSGNAKNAYDLLAPLESERSGNPDYDYLLGLSALESGNAGRAIFALERVLAVNPDHAQARAEIARAHFLLGEHESARTEFRNVLKQQPPEEAKTTINRYMSAIDRALGETTRFGAYLEFILGHDSNVNSAPGPGQVIGNIGGVPLPVNISGTSAELTSNFNGMGGGVNFKHPFNKQWSMFGGASAIKRNNAKTSAELFDTGSVDFNLGLRSETGPNTVTLALQDSHFYLNGERYRTSYGLTGQWQYNWDDRNQFSVYGQLSRLSYPMTTIRNADRRVIGAGYGHAFQGDLSPVLFVSGYGGQEDERESGVSFLGHALYGVRAGGQITANPKTVLFASASYEHRDYGGTRPFFTSSEENHEYDLSIGARYLPMARFQIKPQLSYVRNNSNIPITDFDRYVLSVTFRHDLEW